MLNVHLYRNSQPRCTLSKASHPYVSIVVADTIQIGKTSEQHELVKMNEVISERGWSHNKKHRTYLYSLEIIPLVLCALLLQEDDHTIPGAFGLPPLGMRLSKISVRDELEPVVIASHALTPSCGDEAMRLK